MAYSEYSSQQSTPTPSPRLPAYKKSQWYKTINQFLNTIISQDCYYYAAISFFVVLAIISSAMLPSYCNSDTRLLNCNYCKPCPADSKCSFVSFKCNKNFTQFHSGCIEKELLNEDYINFTEKIIKTLKSHKIKNLNDLCQETNESPLPIRNVLEFIDYKVDEKGNIRKISSTPSKVLFILLTFLTLSSICCAVFLICYRK